jgi:adenylosuccinate synthase
MPLTVIVGGQYGSEGKGKVAHCLAIERQAAIAVRTGGTNSGHTVIELPDRPVVLRQLPTAAFIPDVICVLGPGSYIDPDILLQEISRTGLTADRLLIDPNATIITEEDKERERQGGLRQSIGSTQSGTGAAVIKRMERKAASGTAGSDGRLGKFIHPITPFLRNALTRGARVILEGTQGFGLSPLHSLTYPYVTSRDTTAASFVSEAGLSPMDVDEVVMVLRAFPIRVGGNSGPLPNEIEWSTMTEESGSPIPIVEYTSVTKTVRRVARFDPLLVRQAIQVNAPTHLVLNHIDYIDYHCREERSGTPKALRFVETVESLIGARIDYMGFGPSSLATREYISRRTRLA